MQIEQLFTFEVVLGYSQSYNLHVRGTQRQFSGKYLFGRRFEN